MDLKSIKKELIKYGKRAGKKNFTPGVSGNLSARYNDNIVITTSGSANGYLTEDDFVVIDFEGNVVEGEKKPPVKKCSTLNFIKYVLM